MVRRWMPAIVVQEEKEQKTGRRSDCVLPAHPDLILMVLITVQIFNC